MKSGCFKKFFFGCSAIFLFFFTIFILLLISSELPDIEFSSSKDEKGEYTIELDTLTNEKIFKSTFSWRLVDNRLSKREFKITFKLLEKDVIEAMNYIDQIADMSYTELGLDRNYSDPITESRIVWAKVYGLVYNNSLPQMNSIIEGLNKIFLQEQFDTRDKIYFVITFVQNIKYDRPGGLLDLFPPPATIAYRFGDCDSKAMLLYVLLEKMGVDCAMLWSYNYKHAMLGIKVNGRGNSLTANGKKYFFLETTYPNWEVGEIPPEFNNVKFWYISEIDANIRTQDSETNGNSEVNEREPVREYKPVPSNP